jgi:hypothetical protein
MVMLGLTDGEALHDGADEFESAELTPVGTGDPYDFRSQSPYGGNASRSFIQRGGRNLQSQTRRPGEIAPDGKDSTPRADLQNCGEIQEVLPLFVNSTGKNGDG